MRRIILDTETTGLDFEKDRVIEVGCLELVDNVFTGKKFHQFYNPSGVMISEQAESVHGLSNSFLEDFKTFDESTEDFMDFIGDSKMIIHNAQFDLTMINSSLNRTGKKIFKDEDAICTLEMAKKKFPGSKNNLNALCRRFNISLESREKHGALIDCYLLLEVYSELLGGKQEKIKFLKREQNDNKISYVMEKNTVLHVKVTEEEKSLHEEMLKKINKHLW